MIDSSLRNSAPNTFGGSNKKVLVIGAAGLDIIGRTFATPEKGVSNPAEVHASFGGVARNVAENLARLGQPVRLITVVGNDNLGNQLLEFTAAAGVDVSACLQVEEHTTPSYLAVLDRDRKMQFALDDMRALTALTPAYIRDNARLFKEACLVFIDCNLSLPVLRTVFNQARLARLPVCADATTSLLAPKLLQFLPRLTLITANTHEATILTANAIQVKDRQSALRAARHLVNNGAKIAVIPMAEFGVCYADSETSGHIPSVRTTIMVASGAGDALTATVIFGLLNEIPLDDAVRLGVTAASLALRYPGAVYADLSLEKLYDNLLV